MAKTLREIWEWVWLLVELVWSLAVVASVAILYLQWIAGLLLMVALPFFWVWVIVRHWFK